MSSFLVIDVSVSAFIMSSPMWALAKDITMSTKSIINGIHEFEVPT
jgi:hypothetical protein